MNTRAIAFVDALGFKGLWERFAPEVVCPGLNLFETPFEGTSARHARCAGINTPCSCRTRSAAGLGGIPC